MVTDATVADTTSVVAAALALALKVHTLAHFTLPNYHNLLIDYCLYPIHKLSLTPR